MEKYLEKFSLNEFARCLSLDAFKYGDYRNQKNELEHKDFKQITSNSSLRKVYDNYLDIHNGPGDDSFKEIKIEIWFAKIAYQESRKSQGKQILPNGFMLFLKSIFKELGNDRKLFKDFLEVFVAYHKYYNPRSN